MISPQDYLTITNIIGGGNDDTNNAITDLTSAVTTLQQISGADPAAQSKLGSIILNCITLLQQYRFPNQVMVSAVSALQNHVIKYAGSVNDFLSANAIQVSASFAKISAFAGYAINPSNIVS